MSQVPAATESVATSPQNTSVGTSEKNPTSPASARIHSSGPAQAPKLRSCLVCRTRKVRCDRQSPCSKCRQANISCVFPSTARPPRWARRLERLTNNAASAASNPPAPHDSDPDVAKVMDRLHNLEHLVKELSGQLEQAYATAGSASGGSPGANSPGSSIQDRDGEHQSDMSSVTNTSSVQKQFGRLVPQGAKRSRYVSSGFWSRVNDELEGLRMDTRGLADDESDSSEDDASSGRTPSTQELERTPSERHGFLFRHNLSSSTPNLSEFHPLPSQIPFLLDVFSENVNLFIQIVHIPTVNKMVRDSRGSGMTRFTPGIEALMFSIYYAAITSMEEEDVMTNFGSSKTELNLKYRLGLEHALAKADFLNAPDIVLVQALVIFLSLARRHDSPTFVWMMAGLVIRMAQYLGLQRDGTHFAHLTPFEIEMRRKVWWAVCMLDLRASEDQGTDLTIASGSFDTRIPLNLNDVDLNPETKEMPTERSGVTNMSFARIFFGIGDISRQMMVHSAKDGVGGLEDQSRRLNEIYQKVEQGYFQYTTEPGNIAYWVGVTIARLVVAKMTLLIFLPVLFSPPREHISDDVRTKLLVSAIEVAEYNHALNAEQACRQWRWIYQTHTHWYAIVYLMIETSRRPWSPLVERAWVALHSSWLIPARTPTDKNLRVWIPLRKLMDKAGKHRDAELERLRADQQAAARLEIEDQKFPVPASSGPFSNGLSSVDIFRERWHQLVAILGGPGHGTETLADSSAGLADRSMNATRMNQPIPNSSPLASSPGASNANNISFEPTYFGASGQQTGQTTQESANSRTLVPPTRDLFASGQPSGPPPSSTSSSLSSYDNPLLPTTTVSSSTNNWPSNTHTARPGSSSVPWLYWPNNNNNDAVAPDPSVDNVFATLDMNSSSIDNTMGMDMDMNVDMDLLGSGEEVDWYNWVESARGMEWGDVGMPTQ